MPSSPWSAISALPGSTALDEVALTFRMTFVLFSDRLAVIVLFELVFQRTLADFPVYLAADERVLTTPLYVSISYVPGREMM